MTGFPGGTSLSRVRVYDWSGGDSDLAQTGGGGAPHLHLASTEGYVVLAGHGLLETLSGSGYGEHRLSPGTVLWFTPGTVHRLVNTGGDLEILVVMDNAGLPETGDVVLTFPRDVLADPAAYASAASLPPTRDETELATAARRRRDLAVDGYLALRERVRAEGAGALHELWRVATALVRNRIPLWRELWRDGPLAHTVTIGDFLDNLADGGGDHLADSGVYAATAGADQFGIRGHTRTWDLASA
jgi:hypothetical protein